MHTYINIMHRRNTGGYVATLTHGEENYLEFALPVVSKKLWLLSYTSATALLATNSEGAYAQQDETYPSP